MTRASGKTLALVLGSGPDASATIAALALAQEAVERGHRVAVFAYGAGAQVARSSASTAALVTKLLHDGVHGGLASWVTGDPGGDTAAGVVAGDGGDLWRFIRDADAVWSVDA